MIFNGICNIIRHIIMASMQEIIYMEKVLELPNPRKKCLVVYRRIFYLGQELSRARKF